MKMNRLGKDQRGFSLLELLIVIALTALVTAAITMTIFQVFNMNTRTANRMTAVSQVQNAGKIVSEDIQEAQSVNATEGSGFPLALTRTDPASGDQSRVVYTLVPMPSGILQRLDRSLTVTPLVGNSTTTVSIVAEYIDPEQTSIEPSESCSYPNCGKYTYTFTVTATVGASLIDGQIVGGETETREYEVNPRAGS